MCACLPYENDRVTDGELGIFGDIWVETHNIAVLYRLRTLFDFVVKTHGLSSTPYRASRVFIGSCLIMGCVSRSSAPSNSHSHCTLTV